MRSALVRLLALCPAAAVFAIACEPNAVRSGVEIVSPRANAETTGEVLVQLAVSGARVVPADGSRREGEGHHHLFLDGEPSPADSMIPRRDGIYHLGTGADTLRLSGLAAGSHQLIAVFAYGDHVPAPGVARDTVTFTVR